MFWFGGNEAKIQGGAELRHTSWDNFEKRIKEEARCEGTSYFQDTHGNLIPTMRSSEEDFSEVICPSGSESPYQRLCLTLPPQSHIAVAGNNGDNPPAKITGHSGVNREWGV